MGGPVAGLADMGHGHDTDAEGAMFLTGTMPYRVHSHVAYSNKCFCALFLKKR
jgi:hypothetical protein